MANGRYARRSQSTVLVSISNPSYEPAVDRRVVRARAIWPLPQPMSRMLSESRNWARSTRIFWVNPSPVATNWASDPDPSRCSSTSGGMRMSVIVCLASVLRSSMFPSGQWRSGVAVACQTLKVATRPRWPPCSPQMRVVAIRRRRMLVSETALQLLPS